VIDAAAGAARVAAVSAEAEAPVDVATPS